MVPSVSSLLDCLPPYEDKWQLVHPKQSVKDIIRQMLKAHRDYAALYDNFSEKFDGRTVEEIARNIQDFLKQNIVYREEPEAMQTTALPTGILERRHGDCKHYASFAGGVLDSLNRLRDKKIDWRYRFASYRVWDKTPHHVFVVVDDPASGEEIWIDPTPGASQMTPVWQIDKKIKVAPMALFNNIAGFKTTRATDVVFVDDLPHAINEELSPAIAAEIDAQAAEEQISPVLERAIKVLYDYGVINDAGEISDRVLKELSRRLPQNEFDAVANARIILQEHIAEAAALGGLFDDIWRGIKKVTLAVPRGAFLSVVRLNVFGMATKLYNAIFKEDGSYWQPGQDQIYKKWRSFGGDWNALKNAVLKGAKKKAILGTAQLSRQGVVVACLHCRNHGDEEQKIGAPQLPAWVAVASALIAAFTPLIKDIMKARAQAGQLPAGIDPETGLPIGMNADDFMPSGGGGFDLIGWISANPIAAAGIGVGIYYLVTSRK